MSPKDYYEMHARNHPDAGDSTRPISELGASPSETDIALHWLIPGGQRILDIGCSSLTLLRRAGSIFADRHGVDIAAMPQWGADPAITTQTCDLNERGLPYGDEYFDAVTCLMVMEHVFDPYHLSAEIHRVLKPTGLAVVAVPNIANIKRRAEIMLGRLPITSSVRSFEVQEQGWDGYHLHYFTARSLGWLLRRQGLEPVRWGSQGRLPWLKARWPSLFGNDLIVLARKAGPQPLLPFTP